MSDDYDDELPPISVNSCTRESVALSMPPAEELAASRALEARYEREVRASSAREPVAESSGSEGEAALAAAVAALLVQPQPPRAAPPLAPLLRPLLPDLPALAAAKDHVLEALTDHVCEAAQAGCVTSARELELCASWLILAALARPTHAAHARRALHALLAAHQLTEESEQRVAANVVEALKDCAPSVRAAAADVLTTARGHLTAAVLRHTLAALLMTRPPMGGCACACAWAASAAAAFWGEEAPRGVRCAPRLCARLMAACGARRCGGARALLLRALTAHAHGLEVLVAVSKLQLLFRE